MNATSDHTEDVPLIKKEIIDPPKYSFYSPLVGCIALNQLMMFASMYCGVPFLPNECTNKGVD